MQTGQFQPRRPLPSEIHLQQRFGVARDTVRKAISHLASLGLVRTVPGRGTYVRAPEVTVIAPEPGMRIITRPPTDAERAELGLKRASGSWWPNGPTEALRCSLGTRPRYGWNGERSPRWSGGLCPAARRGRLPCAAVPGPYGVSLLRSTPWSVSVGSLVYVM
ncbi:GntR family transcriptional regulator [Streptosporangium sp. NPDC005286]|uniref:GntR family transcriptional regulator n=1 Tax=Streptosporangium sp. NPDC005286 TaxID=3154463 RepID=UPI00339E4337